MSGVRVPPPASPLRSAVFCALAGLSRGSSVWRPTPTDPSEPLGFVTSCVPRCVPRGASFRAVPLEGSWRTGARPERPGIYVAHSTDCPAYADAAARCRCNPSWRGRRRHPVTGKPEWQKPVVKNRAEVLAWLARRARGRRAPAPSSRRAARSSRTLADQWLDGVERGRIGRRRGKGKAYAETTILAHAPLAGVPRAAGVRPAARRARSPSSTGSAGSTSSPARASSRSTIAKHISVASDIYAWASAPSRRLVPRNPLRLVELPPNDEKPRLRVALAPEAAALLAALEPEDRLPYAIAFYAGCAARRSTASSGTTSSTATASPRRILVRRSKSEAGTQRRPPIADNLRSRPRRRLEAPGPPARRQGRRPLGHVGQDRRARRDGLGRRRA